MPLPFIIGAAAAIAAAAGVGAGVNGAVKMKDANDSIKRAQKRNEKNIKKLKNAEKSTTSAMDKLGELELQALQSFQTFTDVYEKIKNKPKFAEVKIGDVNLSFNTESLKDASVGATVLLGGLGGAAAGTAGGIAAGGAVTAAVMSLGTASTGTLITGLSGAAATNATLAALGGGSLAAGGGGMALGSAVLGGATLGVGLLAAGIIFNFTGSKLAEKAEEIEDKVDEAETQIKSLCDYLGELKDISTIFYDSLRLVYDRYIGYLDRIVDIVNVQGRTNWKDFDDSEKLAIQVLVRLVSVLYNMCKVKLVNKAKKNGKPGAIKKEEAYDAVKQAEDLLSSI